MPSMFTRLYDASAKTIFQNNIMARHPIILALFSGAPAGRMILYRPGKPAEEASSVPVVYQVMKSTGHSTMAIFRGGHAPISATPADKSWMAPLLALPARR